MLFKSAVFPAYTSSTSEMLLIVSHILGIWSKSLRRTGIVQSTSFTRLPFTNLNLNITSHNHTYFLNGNVKSYEKNTII